MFKIGKRLQVTCLMVKNEGMGIVVHPLEQLPAFADDGLALTPRQHRGKQPGNLDVLLLRERMRNGHRIILNEGRPVELVSLFIQELLQLGRIRFLRKFHTAGLNCKITSIHCKLHHRLNIFKSAI